MCIVAGKQTIMPMNIITILDLPFMILNSWHQTTFFFINTFKKKKFKSIWSKIVQVPDKMRQFIIKKIQLSEL